MITEAIILAGGLGTRLRDAVPELPKCMAPVNGKPFIWYLVDHLQKQGVTHFIFALGYKSEAFDSFLSSVNINYKLSIEKEPLGTGGAIKLAVSQVSAADVIVTNGDTLFKIDVQALYKTHHDNNADCTLSLKPMKQFSRYGVVEVGIDKRIICFKEKAYYEAGLINGGFYALNTNKFQQEVLPEKFSFETDYLEKLYSERDMFGFVQDEYFIDIGIPEDYQRAQIELIQ
jgi:D-glycero-alpha-D-manno-heptose 1-phosphate guanylyltransferase